MHAPVLNLIRLTATTGLLLGIIGCEAQRGVRPDVPPPTLQLLSTMPLKLPATCAIEGSIAIEFAVLADGQTAEIAPIAAPECARTALVEWVASFRYAPPAQRMQSRIEWLVVAASRRS